MSEVRWDDWPLVTLTAGAGSAADFRESILGMLGDALERGTPFAAVVDMSRGVPGAETDPPGRAAEHARAVKEMRPALAERCRGLAFVAPGSRAASDRFWGCPATTVGGTAEAYAWVRERGVGADS